MHTDCYVTRPFDTEFRVIARKRLGRKLRANKLVFVPRQVTHANSQSVKNPTSGTDDHKFLGIYELTGPWEVHVL